MPATDETTRPNLTDGAEFTRSTEPLRRETYLRGLALVRRLRGSRVGAELALTHRSRRVLPSGLGAPNGTEDEPPVGVQWLQPAPDALTAGVEAGPAELVDTRASVRLAFVAGLQYLPPRQRAVLLLRDVLALPATEVAGVLGMPVSRGQQL